MKMNSAFRSGIWLVVPALVVWSIALSAQRGGGRGSAAPPTATEYDSKEHGLFFPVPEGLSLFTPDKPGRFASVLREADRRIALLVNLMEPEVTISVKCSVGVSEADLVGLKQTLDTNPPQAKLPGYQKISVETPKVGVHGDKDSVSYVYTATEDNVAKTTRQVMFVHKGQGFTVICAAPEKKFANVNKKVFDRLFATMDFR